MTFRWISLTIGDNPTCPEHECAYTYRRGCTFGINGALVSGAGVTPAVVWPALRPESTSWIGGDAGRFPGETLVFVAQEVVNGPLETLGHGPAVTLADPEELFAMVERGEAQLWYITHDDCMFSAKLDPGRMRDLIQNILRMHAFYLGREFAYDAFIEPVTALAEAHKIEIIARVKKGDIAVFRAGKNGWFRRPLLVIGA